MSIRSEPLRPLSLGEILDRTAQLYRQNFLLFAGVAAAPTGVLLAVFAVVGALIAAIGVTVRGSLSPDLMTGLLVAAILLVGLPVGIAAAVVSQAALTRTAVNAQMGERLTIRAALKGVWPRFWRYLWLLILQAIVIALIPGVAAGIVLGVLGYLGSLAGGGAAASAVLGFIAVVIVIAVLVYIVWRALCYSMGMAVCVVEGKSAWESLKRARKLSRGTRGRILLMGLLVWALSVVISIVGYIPIAILAAAVTVAGHGAEYAAVTLIVAEILNVLVNFALQTLITPVYITALVLFYYDQRIRTEGYDIERMMEQAGLISGTPGLGAGASGAVLMPAADPDSVMEP